MTNICFELVCLPDPNSPYITPDSESLNIRKHLEFIWYGEIIIFFIFIGISVSSTTFSGFYVLLQLVDIWLAYCSWATMSGCIPMCQFCLDFF